jgi:hypothetical protein
MQDLYKVKFSPDERRNARNLGCEKETTNRLVLVATTKRVITEVVDARFYMSRTADGASPVYCSVWIHGRGVNRSGYGKASGYGYHKESDALESALESAGVTLSQHIGGRGERAMETALRSIARSLGFRGQMLIV